MIDWRTVCADAAAGVRREVWDGDAGEVDIVELTEASGGVEERESGKFQTIAGGAFHFGLALLVHAGVENVPVVLGDFGGGSVERHRTSLAPSEE